MIRGATYTGKYDQRPAELDTAAAAESTVFTLRMGLMPTIEVVPELVARPADADYAASNRSGFISHPLSDAAHWSVVPRTMMVKIDRSVSNPYAASNNAYLFWAEWTFWHRLCAAAPWCALLEEP